MVLAGSLLGALAGSAVAAPTDVLVRVETPTETLFEGPVLSEGHAIRAESGTEAHPCNGTNDGANKTPGDTPTAATVDAMALIGEGFNGEWYGEGYDDYLITGWGGVPAKGQAEGRFWSLYVNDATSRVGGCQYELAEGAEVLWVFGAPLGSPLLELIPAGYSGALPPLLATARLGVPCVLEVRSYDSERPVAQQPQASGATPVAGASVSPVSTAANGSQTLQTGSPETVQSDAEGRVSLTFSTPGWHRVKASAASGVRSNRLDICVPAEGASGCGTPPLQDLARAPDGALGAASPSGACAAQSSSSPKVSSPTPNGGGSSSTASTGQTETSTSKTPRSQFSRVRVAGRILMALAAGSPLVHYRGRWRHRRVPGVWGGSLASGTSGARLSVLLPAGQPVLMLRAASAHAVVEISADGHRRRLRPRAFSGATRLLMAGARSAPGLVLVRVLGGSVALEGVAASA